MSPSCEQWFLIRAVFGGYSLLLEINLVVNCSADGTASENTDRTGDVLQRFCRKDGRDSFYIYVWFLTVPCLFHSPAPPADSTLSPCGQLQGFISCGLQEGNLTPLHIWNQFLYLNQSALPWELTKQPPAPALDDPILPVLINFIWSSSLFHFF